MGTATAKQDRQSEADLEAIADEFWAALEWDEGAEAEEAFDKAVFEGSI